MNLHDIFESKAFRKQDVVRADDKPQIVPPELDGSSPHPYQGKLVGEDDDTSNTKQHPAGEGKKMSKRTKQQIMAEMTRVQNKLAEAEDTLDPESALRQARSITKGIKYDDTATDIIVKLQMLAERVPGIDMSTLEYHVRQVHEAKSALDSAVYGLEEAFEDLVNASQDSDLEETSIHSDRMRSFIVYDKSSGKILQIDVSPSDLPLAVAQHQRAGYDAGYKRQTAKHFKGDVLGESELNEVSKKTLGSYVANASADAAHQTRAAGQLLTPGGRNVSKYQDYENRAEKRLHGIRTAIGKLTKESTDDTLTKNPKDNITQADLKELEGLMNDLPAMKARALEMVKHEGPRSLKPEKMVHFTRAINDKQTSVAVMKVMIDMFLAGEGLAVVGTKHSMRPNSYRDRYGKNK